MRQRREWELRASLQETGGERGEGEMALGRSRQESLLEESRASG